MGGWISLKRLIRSDNMRVTLDTDEIMKAMSVYMALKGFGMEDGFVDFKWDAYAREAIVSATFNIKPVKTDLERIMKYVNE